MRRQTILTGFVVLTVLIVMVGGHSISNPNLTEAQTSANYNLEWHVIGGGGKPVDSAHYAVNSTAGQGAASPPYLDSPSYAISSGYWFVPDYSAYSVYLPVALNNY
jgi:hypothetical protein